MEVVDCIVGQGYVWHDEFRRAAALAGSLGAADCLDRLIKVAETGAVRSAKSSVPERDDVQANLAHGLAAAGCVAEAVTAVALEVSVLCHRGVSACQRTLSW